MRAYSHVCVLVTVTSRRTPFATPHKYKCNGTGARSTSSCPHSSWARISSPIPLKSCTGVGYYFHLTSAIYAASLTPEAQPEPNDGRLTPETHKAGLGVAHPA